MIGKQPFRGKDCLDELLTRKFHSVIDVGCGDLTQYQIFKDHGKDVTGVSLRKPCDVLGDFMDVDLEKADCLWACHVLEHQLNVHSFLKKAFSLAEIVAITVPPLKTQIAAGHYSLWTLENLIYNIVLCGIDCSDCWFKEYDYNISVIVEKNSIELPDLKHDAGDLFLLDKFFPFKVAG